MKIVSWNCGAAFYTQDKYKKIRELDADVYVISEFNKPKKLIMNMKNLLKIIFILNFLQKKMLEA